MINDHLLRAAFKAVSIGEARLIAAFGNESPATIGEILRGERDGDMEVQAAILAIMFVDYEHRVWRHRQLGGDRD